MLLKSDGDKIGHFKKWWGFVPSIPSVNDTYATTTTANQLATPVCCPGSTMVERAPHRHQDSRNSPYFPSQTENSPVQTAPWPIKKTLSLISLNVAYLMKLMSLHDSCNLWFVSTWLNALIVTYYLAPAK